MRSVLERSVKRLESVPRMGFQADSLYSFLPARGGVGASFLAVQTALNLPLASSNRALLIDGDLDAGMIAFMVKVQNHHSLIEALERVEDLDESLWPQFVASQGYLDIMQSSDFGGDYHPDLNRLQQLLAFVKKQYSTILVDLPSAISRLSVEVMQQSKSIYLVTTPEVASLNMARRRYRALLDFQLGSQVRLIVNRVDWKEAGKMSSDEIASVVVCLFTLVLSTTTWRRKRPS